MVVYRIAKTKYAGSLVSSGKAGRWNLPDQFVIYTSASRSLASLELMVNSAGVRSDMGFKVMAIDIPDAFNSLSMDILPENWRQLEAYPHLQALGSLWYTHQESLVLQVPSAVVPQEQNYLINTKHPDFNKVMLKDTEDYHWDERLL